jgi:hypothetical protein
MAGAERTLREVSLTQARNLSPLFDEAVRREHPVLIVRNRREWGLLLSRDAMVRMLATYRFQVHVLPEEDNGFTLWIEELDIGAHGPTPSEASRALLAAVRSYVAEYREQFDFYRHLPDRARLEPYVLRLSLARDDAELLEILFPSAPTGEAGPLHKAAG